VFFCDKTFVLSSHPPTPQPTDTTTPQSSSQTPSTCCLHPPPLHTPLPPHTQPPQQPPPNQAPKPQTPQPPTPRLTRLTHWWNVTSSSLSLSPSRSSGMSDRWHFIRMRPTTSQRRTVPEGLVWRWWWSGLAKGVGGGAMGWGIPSSCQPASQTYGTGSKQLAQEAAAPLPPHARSQPNPNQTRADPAPPSPPTHLRPP